MGRRIADVRVEGIVRTLLMSRRQQSRVFRAGCSSRASTQSCELRASRIVRERRIVRECRVVRGPRAFGRSCGHR
jgi:hypothetical protein